MKVSVIIPAFNEEGYIQKCLESILNQIDKADEVIVIDNNSKDKTAEISKKMGVTVIKEKKQGITPARNKGFDSAKYEIIARVDADVIVPPNWIQKIKHNFKTYKIDALSGPVSYYDGLIKAPLPAKVYFKAMKLVLKNKDVLLGMNMILTKSIWERVKPLTNVEDSLVHEDIDLSINIAKVGGKIKYDPNLIVEASARRINKKPTSFFIEYPVRLITTLQANSKKL